MQCPKAALFDLDDTLAPSFESPSAVMIAKLLQLLEKTVVGIITGRDLPWMKDDFLPRFAESKNVSNFYVLPEGGALATQWNGHEWVPLYSNSLSEEEFARITAVVKQGAQESGILEGLPVFGNQFRLKQAMVAFSTIGVDAPRGLRYSWDPGNIRRTALAKVFAELLPEYDVVMGGATTIDITKKGINKGYGVRWLAEHLHCAPSDMLYVGDALYEGGNDAVVIPTGIRTIQTTGPAHTEAIVQEIIGACRA